MINVNLLPPEIKAEIDQTKKNLSVLKVVGKVAALFLSYILIAIGFYFYFSTSLKTVVADYNNKEGQIKKYGALEEKAKKIAERINTIKQIQDNTNVWSGVIDEVTTVVPNGVSLSNIKIDSATKNRNTITGNATTKADVAALRDAMEKSAKFQYVDIESSATTKDPISNREFELFTISFTLEKGALK
jgi:Tfp pilus assembly protein PilN